MKKDYSQIPATKVVTNKTKDEITFSLRDEWRQVPITIEPESSVEIKVQTSEGLANLTKKVEELELVMEDGENTPTPEPEEPQEPVEVTDESSLRQAITSGAQSVKLTNNVSVASGNLDITGVKEFNGNGKTITFNSTGQNFVAMSDATIENVVVENAVATNDWSSTYGVQCYNGTYTLKNITSKGGNAGILVNSANVTLAGTIDVSENKFGGIEVSKSSNPDTNNSTLNVNGATLINTTEEYGKPTIWTDGEGQTVNGVSSMFANSEVKAGQVQYYLEEQNASAPEVVPPASDTDGDETEQVSPDSEQSSEGTDVVEPII